MIEAKQLYGAKIDAQDGYIGSVHDLYFDDQAWTVRYLIVDTGKWLPGRKVLVAPAAILQPWHGEAAVPVELTKSQIRISPDIDTAQPISRKAEHLLHSHYDWIPYWGMPGIPEWEMPGIPAPPLPPPLAASSIEERRDASKEAESLSEQHLRSTREVMGYRVGAIDGEIGHIEDFVLDDDCSRVLFLTIDLEEWILGKQVLLSPRLVSKIDWATSRVLVDVSRQAIKTSQAYKSAA
jgi:uncharacterized protein YrrD